MIHPRACLAVLSLLLPFSLPLSAQTPAPQNPPRELTRFEPQSTWVFIPGAEFPGATGSLTTKSDEGKTTGLLAFDFTGGGNYVAAQSDIALPEGSSELRLKVRSSENRDLALRLCDSKGQWHSVKLAYDGAGEWGVLRVDLANFHDDSHFGGPNDGVLYYPVKRVQFLLGKPPTGATGTLEFTNITAQPGSQQLAAQTPATQKSPLELTRFEPRPTWIFIPGAEFPGASGSVSAKTDDGKTIGLLAFDFTGGGNYVAAQSDIALPEGYSELRLKARSSENRDLALRIRDAKDQWHSVNLAYSGAGEWGVLRVDLANFHDDSHFGGPNDGVLYYPLRQVQFLLGNKPPLSPTGTLEFTNITAQP
ncbi:MAG: hypothetical protein WC003_03495 [Terrimicrobiaceae bacterium]